VSHGYVVLLAGLPYVRPMPPIPAVAGQQLVVKCPVAGYPIDTIIWDKGKSQRHHCFVVHVNRPAIAASWYPISKRNFTVKTVPFWVISQQGAVIPYRRFGATYRSYLQSEITEIYFHIREKITVLKLGG